MLKSRLASIFRKFFVVRGVPKFCGLKSVADYQELQETCHDVRAFFAGRGKISFNNEETNPFFHWETMKTNLYYYRLSNVVLDSYYMILLKDGKVIPDSNYVIPESILETLRVRNENVISYPKNDVVACCFDHWSHNYFHWLTHAVPTLYFINKNKPQTTLLMPQLQNWQKRTLELLGINLESCFYIKKEDQYFFPALDYYDSATGRADFAISTLAQQAYQYMIAAASLSDAPEFKHEKIYISRVKKNHRQVCNEEELIVALRQRGYQIVEPENLTIDEQITVFQNARIVVALLGAGLANIAFCKPGTVVYELIPSHHQNPCFLKLSMQGNLAYWADKFETGITHNQPDHLSRCLTALDIGFVMNRLDELEPLLHA